MKGREGIAGQAVGLALVFKHLSGQHDQQSHAGDRGHSETSSLFDKSDEQLKGIYENNKTLGKDVFSRELNEQDFYPGEKYVDVIKEQFGDIDDKQLEQSLSEEPDIIKITIDGSEFNGLSARVNKFDSQNALFDKLKDNDDFLKFANHNVDSSIKSEYQAARFQEATKDMTDKQVQDYIVKQEIRNSVDLWSSTSGDTEPKAVAMQMAAKELFQTGEVDHLSKNIENTPGKRIDLREELEGNPGRKAFLQAQYDATQDYLKKNNIKELVVYRGQEGKKSKLPEGKSVDIDMQPLSSFSLSIQDAVSFANPTDDYRAKEKSPSVIASVVPASRVFAMPNTGIGCTSEHEVVLVGGRMKATVVTGIPHLNSTFVDDTMKSPNDFKRAIERVGIKLLGLQTIIKGGPGSGSWEGPGQPRFAHENGESKEALLDNIDNQFQEKPEKQISINIDNLTTDKKARDVFDKVLKLQYPYEVPCYHEASISALDGIMKNGLTSGESVEDTNFATIGKPSRFVSSDDKLIIKFSVGYSEKRHWLTTNNLIPDMRYGETGKESYKELLKEHNGVFGADIAYDGNILPKAIDYIVIIKNNKAIEKYLSFGGKFEKREIKSLSDIFTKSPRKPNPIDKDQHEFKFREVIPKYERDFQKIIQRFFKDQADEVLGSIRKGIDEIHTKSISQEMRDHFEERTKLHISLVQRYLQKIIDLNDKRLDNDILEGEKDHDQSKYEDPEFESYLHVNWHYYMESQGEKYDPPQEIKDKMDEATYHHVKNNKHHPEYWDDKITIDSINRVDKDKPPSSPVNAIKMPMVYVASMVADWLAMSEEKKTDPYEWAKKNIGIRWVFTLKQVELIYDLLMDVWKSEKRYGLAAFKHLSGQHDQQSHGRSGSIVHDNDVKDQPAEKMTFEEALNDKRVFWHGSPSGDLRGGATGLHLGTFEAAHQALDATIGIPVEGYWDGTREYGKTLLAGQNRIREEYEAKGKYYLTGYSVDAPEEDHYPTGKATYSNHEKIPMDVKPEIKPYRLIGEMSNSRVDPHDDAKANGMMRGQLARGNAKRGYFYTNIGEDAGSISIVVPSKSHVRQIEVIDKKSFDSLFIKGGFNRIIKASPNAFPDRFDFGGWSFDKKEWNDRLQKEGGLFIKEMYDKEGIRAYDGLKYWIEDLAGAFNIDEPLVQEFLDNYVFTFANNINTTTEELLRAAMKAGMDEGLGMTGIASKIEGLYNTWDQWRSLLIARTETIRASNSAAVEAYRQSGVVEGKEWLVTLDDRLCPICRPMQGKIIDLDKNFFDKGDSVTIGDGDSKITMKLDYEDVGEPPLHPNCRCAIVAWFSDREKDLKGIETKHLSGQHDQQSHGAKSSLGSKDPKTEDDKQLKSLVDQMTDLYAQNKKPEGWQNTSFYDLLAKHAKFFTPAELPKDVKSGKVKGCYRNASQLAMDYPDKYTYVEGIAISKNLPIPINHAFCIDNKTGNVVDPTWSAKNGLMAGTSYFGIPFTSQYLRKTLVKTGTYGMIPDYPTDKYNPVKTGFSKDAFSKKDLEKINLDEIKDKPKDKEHYHYIEDYVEFFGNKIYLEVIVPKQKSLGLQTIIKGGPGSGSWEGPGNPRFAHEGSSGVGREIISIGGSGESKLPSQSDVSALVRKLKKTTDQKDKVDIDTNQMERDPDVNRILKEGEFFKTDKIILMEGKEGQCHWNVANLFKNNKIDSIVIGYTREDLYGKGLWYQHTWGLKDGKIVDTDIHYRQRIMYYGLKLNVKESEEFAFYVEQHPPGGGVVRRVKYLGLQTIFKGGPGSGIRGHRTNRPKKPSKRRKLTPAESQRLDALLKEKAKREKVIDVTNYPKDASEITHKQRMNQADIKDIKSQMKKNLQEIQKGKPDRQDMDGELSTETSGIIRKNMNAELQSYASYLAGDTALRARDYIDQFHKSLYQGIQDGSLKGVNSKDLDALGLDSVRKLIHQEVESNRQAFTDHGIRHIEGDVSRAVKLAEAMNPKLTGKESLMINFALVNHDVGYTVPLIRAGGGRGVAITKDHPAFSEKIAQQQEGQWNRDKIFSKDEYNKITEAIKTHDSTDIKGGNFLTAIRVSDNLSLFNEEKLPSMFKNVSGGDGILVRMGMAAKKDDKKAFETLRDELHGKIDKANLNENLKRDLKAATKEISYVTPKFTLGVLAGYVSDIKKTGDKVDVTIKHNSYDAKMQKIFDMGQKQTKKFLGDYGITDFSKTEYDIGGKISLKVEGYKGSGISGVLPKRIGLGMVAKHLAGQHDQQSHAGVGNSKLSGLVNRVRNLQLLDSESVEYWTKIHKILDEVGGLDIHDFQNLYRKDASFVLEAIVRLPKLDPEQQVSWHSFTADDMKRELSYLERQEEMPEGSYSKRAAAITTYEGDDRSTIRLHTLSDNEWVSGLNLPDQMHNKAGVMTAVTMHEYAHVMDTYDRYSMTDKWQEAWEGSRKVSGYASHNAKEGFAESVTLMGIRPAYFSKKYPELYDAISELTSWNPRRGVEKSLAQEESIFEELPLFRILHIDNNKRVILLDLQKSSKSLGLQSFMTKKKFL